LLSLPLKFVDFLILYLSNLVVFQALAMLYTHLMIAKTLQPSEIASAVILITPFEALHRLSVGNLSAIHSQSAAPSHALEIFDVVSLLQTTAFPREVRK